MADSAPSPSAANPYLVQNYAIEVDGLLVGTWDRSMGRAISDTYDQAAHIWRGILLKAKEIQSVQPS